MYVYIYIYIYIYTHTHKRVFKGLRVKPQVEVLTFGAFMFKIYVKPTTNMSKLPLAYVIKLQSLLIEQLNQYRYIFDTNCLLYNVSCITLFIVSTKMLPF